MTIKILPYKAGSRSARALATALGCKVLNTTAESRYKPRSGDTIINWGRSTEDTHPVFERTVLGLYKTLMLNAPCDVAQVSNKLRFFEEMQFHCLSDLLPKFFTNKDDIQDEDFPIVARTILNGHSGAGIVLCNDRASLVDAPLYTRYLKKKDEYRVHLGLTSSGTTIISVQRKARRLDHSSPNWQVRNHANGFNYVRDTCLPPQPVIEVATTVFEASDLDFGAIDVVFNEQMNKAWVLEINTAPGLEGQTVTDYATYFKGVI